MHCGASSVGMIVLVTYIPNALAALRILAKSGTSPKSPVAPPAAWIIEASIPIIGIINPGNIYIHGLILRQMKMSMHDCRIGNVITLGLDIAPIPKNNIESRYLA